MSSSKDWERFLADTIAVVRQKGVKGKYKPELVEDILTAIAKTGSDKDSCKFAKLHPATFYRWLTEPSKREFHDGVARAREEWRLYHRPETAVEDAQRALSDYAAGRMVEKWEKRTEFFDKDGNLTGSSVTAMSKTIPCPHWVVDRVLGPLTRRLAVLDAANILLQHGLLTQEQVLTISTGLDHMESSMRLLSQKHSGTSGDADAIAVIEALDS